MKYSIGDIVMLRRDAGIGFMWRARVLWIDQDGMPTTTIDVDRNGKPVSWETREISQSWHVTPLTDIERGIGVAA